MAAVNLLRWRRFLSAHDKQRTAARAAIAAPPHVIRGAADLPISAIADPSNTRPRFCGQQERKRGGQHRAATSQGEPPPPFRNPSKRIEHKSSDATTGRLSQAPPHVTWRRYRIARSEVMADSMPLAGLSHRLQTPSDSLHLARGAHCRQCHPRLDREGLGALHNGCDRRW